MKVLIEVNVVLDLMLDRERHVREAIEVMSLSEEGTLQGYLCGAGVSTIHYVARKKLGAVRSRAQLGKLLRFLGIAPVDGSVVERALSSPVSDLGDAITTESARAVGASAIVTRDLRDFAKSGLRVYLPGELIAAIEIGTGPPAA